MEIVATILGLCFGTISTLIAVRNYIKSIKEQARQRLEEEKAKQVDAGVKKYAAERDFGHLKNNQEQMKIAIQLLQDETDAQNDTLIEMKTLQGNLIQQIERLSQKLDSVSSYKAER